jgi:hypothetical protein
MKTEHQILLLVVLGLVVVVGLGIVVWSRSDSEDREVAAETESFEALDPTLVAQLAAMRDPDVPELPFPDNPDPSQCGIPSQWSGDARAWLNGYYQDEMVQPIVLLYNSHSRLNSTAQAPHGTEVKVVLYQINPVVNYYMVKIVGPEDTGEGWIPAPFLSFDPVEPLQES